MTGLADRNVGTGRRERLPIMTRPLKWVRDDTTDEKIPPFGGCPPTFLRLLNPTAVVSAMNKD